MSKIRLSLFARNLVVALLLAGMAVGLTACPEGVAYTVTDGRPDNHNSGGSSSGGSY